MKGELLITKQSTSTGQIRVTHQSNTIVDRGRSTMCYLLARAQKGYNCGQIGLGYSDAPTDSKTSSLVLPAHTWLLSTGGHCSLNPQALTTRSLCEAQSGTWFPDTGVLYVPPEAPVKTVFQVVVPPSEGNGGPYKEAGLFSINGTLFARTVLQTHLTKNPDERLTLNWTITF